MECDDPCKTDIYLDAGNKIGDESLKGRIRTHMEMSEFASGNGGSY